MAVSMSGNSLPGDFFSVTAQFYFRARGNIYRMGTAAKASPNLCLAVWSYQNLVII